MNRLLIGLLVLPLLLSACAGKETKYKYAAHKYTQCGAFYEVLSQQFDASVQRGIRQVGETMYAAGRMSAVNGYPAGQGEQEFEREKQEQLARMQELFAKQDKAAADKYSASCQELGNNLINAMGKRK